MDVDISCPVCQGECSLTNMENAYRCEECGCEFMVTLVLDENEEPVDDLILPDSTNFLSLG